MQKTFVLEMKDRTRIDINVTILPAYLCRCLLIVFDFLARLLLFCRFVVLSFVCWLFVVQLSCCQRETFKSIQSGWHLHPKHPRNAQHPFTFQQETGQASNSIRINCVLPSILFSSQFSIRCTKELNEIQIDEENVGR